MKWFILALVVLSALQELIKLIQRKRNGEDWSELFEEESEEAGAAEPRQSVAVAPHTVGETSQEFFQRMEAESRSRHEKRVGVLSQSLLPEIALPAAPEVLDIPVSVAVGGHKRRKKGGIEISSKDIDAMRKAIVLNEVLAKPKCFRF